MDRKYECVNDGLSVIIWRKKGIECQSVKIGWGESACLWYMERVWMLDKSGEMDDENMGEGDGFWNCHLNEYTLVRTVFGKCPNL